MKADDWAALAEAEWGIVEDVIAQVRAPLLGGLLQLRPTMVTSTEFILALWGRGRWRLSATLLEQSPPDPTGLFG